MRITATLVLALCGISPHVHATNIVGYQLSDLGALQAPDSHLKGGLLAINNAGHAIGNFGQLNPAAGYYDGQTYQPLSAIEPGLSDSMFSTGRDISNTGYIGGDQTYLVSGTIPRTYGYIDGPTTPVRSVGVLAGGRNSSIMGVNNLGMGTGWADNSWGQRQAVVYSNGALRNIHTLTGTSSTDSWGAAINDQGHVTGSTLDDQRAERAFVYNGQSLSILSDLGQASRGMDINQSGLVVGNYTALADSAYGAVSRGFLFDGQNTVDLGSLGGGLTEVQGINASGLIVGRSTVTSSTDWHVFVSNGQQMTDVTALLDASAMGWELVTATDINDLGQIVGTAWVNGSSRGYMLTPIMGPVPEPSLAALCGLGIASLAMVARRRGTAPRPQT